MTKDVQKIHYDINKIRRVMQFTADLAAKRKMQLEEKARKQIQSATPRIK